MVIYPSHSVLANSNRNGVDLHIEWVVDVDVVYGSYVLRVKSTVKINISEPSILSNCLATADARMMRPKNVMCQNSCVPVHIRDLLCTLLSIVHIVQVRLIKSRRYNGNDFIH